MSKEKALSTNQDPQYVMQTIYSVAAGETYLPLALPNGGRAQATTELFVYRTSLAKRAITPEPWVNRDGSTVERAPYRPIVRHVIGSYMAPIALDAAEIIRQTFGGHTNEFGGPLEARTAIDVFMSHPHAEADSQVDELILNMDVRKVLERQEAARREIAELAIAGRDDFTATALARTIAEQNEAFRY